MSTVSLTLTTAAAPIAIPLVGAAVGAIPAFLRHLGVLTATRSRTRLDVALAWVPAFTLVVATVWCVRLPDEATIRLGTSTLSIGPLARAASTFGCGASALVALLGAAAGRTSGTGIAAAVIAPALVLAAYAGDIARVGAAGIHVAAMVAAIAMALDAPTGFGGLRSGWRAATAYLTGASLGLVTIVAGLSLADVLRVSPGGLVTESFVIAILGAGFALTIGLPPLHYWVPVVAWRPGTGSAAMALGVVVPAAVGYLVQVVAGVPHLGGAEMTERWATVGGLIACVAGAIGALAPMPLGRRIGYASIGGIGPVLLGLGTGTRIGVAGAMVAIVHHAICTIVLVASAAHLESVTSSPSSPASDAPPAPSLPSTAAPNPTPAKHPHPQPLPRQAGEGSRTRRYRLAFMLAAAAASGIPPLGGFGARWAIMQALSLQDWRLAMTLGITALTILGALLSAVARPRQPRAIVTPTPPNPSPADAPPFAPGEGQGLGADHDDRWGPGARGTVGQARASRTTVSPSQRDPSAGGEANVLLIYAFVACAWGVAPGWIIDYTWRATATLGYLRPF